MKYPLIKPLIDEIGGGIETLARATGMEPAELNIKLTGDKELTLDEAIILSDAFNSCFGTGNMFTPYIFRCSIATELSEDEKQRRKLNERRSGIPLSPEDVVFCLKGMRKKVLYSKGFAQSYEANKEMYGEAVMKEMADIDYDALTYAIETVEALSYRRE